MAPTKTRQRKLERDRYERKMVRRAQQQRQRRRLQAGLGAFLALAVLGTGTAWLMGAFEPAPEEVPLCTWEAQEGPERTDVGTPDADPPTEGTRTITVNFGAGSAGSGEVVIEADLTDEPCGIASMAHLAAAGFYEGTSCHELTAEGALRCGDPSGTGTGGPGYAFYGRNFPLGELDPATPTPAPAEGEEPEPLYPAGTVALADVTGAHGSQLLFFYQDYAPEQAIWPILGTVTSGLDLLEAIGEAGADGEPPAPPAEEVQIQTVTVTDPQETP